MDPFCNSCFVFVLFILSCLFLASLCSPVGKGLPSWLSGICFLLLVTSHYGFLVYVFLFLVTFQLWFSGSDVVLDCIDV